MRGDLARRLRAAPVGALAALPLVDPLSPPPPDPAPPPPPPSHPQPAPAVAYRNPVFAQTFPDPTVIRVGGMYYAYGTTTRGSGIFPILRSRDLVRWSRAGNAFRRPPRWTSRDWWAPAVIQHHRRFHLFYAAHRRRGGGMCVAVAVARRPTGPFHHRVGLSCSRPGGDIDPAPFIDNDGRAYLYFVRGNFGCERDPRRCAIQVQRLRPDLLATVGRPRRVLLPSQPWERRRDGAIVENPWVFRSGGRYFMLYSGNDWRSDYAMGYAVASSPLGPFRKVEPRPFLSGRPGYLGPGGGSVIRGPRSGLWLVYHARRSGVIVRNDTRTLHIDPLWREGERLIVPGPSSSRHTPP